MSLSPHEEDHLGDMISAATGTTARAVIEHARASGWQADLVLVDGLRNVVIVGLLVDDTPISVQINRTP